MSFNLVMFIRTVHSKQNHSSIGPRVLHLHSTVIMQHYKYIFFLRERVAFINPQMTQTLEKVADLSLVVRCLRCGFCVNALFYMYPDVSEGYIAPRKKRRR